MRSQQGQSSATAGGDHESPWGSSPTKGKLALLVPGGILDCGIRDCGISGCGIRDCGVRDCGYAIHYLRNGGSAAAGTTSILLSAKLRTVSEWTKAENALSTPSLKLSRTRWVQPQKTDPQLTSCSEHILLSQLSRNHCQSFFFDRE